MTFKNRANRALDKIITKSNILTIAALLGACLTLLTASFHDFAEKCEQLQGEILRLHILPHSDGADDIQLKYELRDFLLANAKDYFAEVSTLDEAIKTAAENLPETEKSAKDFIKSRGYDYNVKISVETMFFTTRVYENITMPAGDYAALRVIIGEGGGQNWWCVIFPPLCLPAVSQRGGEPYFSAEANRVTESGKGGIEVRFRIYEWFRDRFK